MVNDPRIAAYVQAVAEAMTREVRFDSDEEAAAFRSSCAQMVKLHVEMARGGKTLNLYLRQLAAQDTLRAAMKEQISHLMGDEVIWDVTGYIDMADKIAQKLAR